MIHKIIGWWKGQPIIVKILSGLFVGIILVVLVVGSILLRRKVSEFGVVDTAVDIHEEQSKRRQDELNRQDEEGKKIIAAADEVLERLKKDGQEAEEEREERDDEIREADDWGDLDRELGSARDRGRTGSR